MSKQVLSTEQMRHLQELGVDTSEASAIIYKISETETYCGYAREVVLVEGFVEDYIDKVETFTLQDIIDKLPCFIDTYVFTLQKLAGTYTCLYMEPYSRSILFLKENKELIDAAYDMLCWCIENGYILKRVNNESENKRNWRSN